MYGQTQRIFSKMSSGSKMMEAKIPIEIRFLNRDEWETAMGLAGKVFLAFEGDVYSKEGVRSFEDFITSSVLKRLFDQGAYQVLAAYDGPRMIGMISLRNQCHISLLFVDGAYHRQGVGSALMAALSAYVTQEMGQEKLTVNAAPYAVGFYHRLGFTDLGPCKEQDGIIYTPMIRFIR